MTSNFYISDVVLTATGESVMGANAPGALSPDYDNSTPVEITVLGKFPGAFTEAGMRFTYEPGILTQNFVGELPTVRALLHDVLILEPKSVSASSMTLAIQAGAIPDLQQQGLLKLTLTTGSVSQSAFLRFDVPFAPDHFPVIHQVAFQEIDGSPVLEVQGSNFYLSPEANQCWLDGEKQTSLQTQILWNGTSQLWLKLKTNPVAGSHHLRCHTPRGLNEWEGTL